jgi:GT2 family glycosyltransferase
LVADPRLTLIVLTYNRREEVVRTVGHSLALPDAPRVIVVDNGSSDGTPSELRSRFPTVGLISSAVNLGASGRNLGLAAATSSYVALCDDDTWWSPGSLRRCCDVLDRHPSVAVVCARVVVGPDGREDPTSILMAGSPLPPGRLPGPRVLGFLAGASVVRRDAVLGAGGFCPPFFLGGEEELLAVDLVSAGWDLIYLHGAVVHHHPSVHRDSGTRRVLTLRNALWTTWLRWPAVAAARRTMVLLAQARDDDVLGPVLKAALSGWSWAMANRRSVQGQLAADMVAVLSRR